MSIDTEQFIREAAAKGWSKLMTRTALGIGRNKFSLMVEALPDVKWPKQGTSVGAREWLARRVVDREASGRGGRAAAANHLREAFGKKDTLIGFSRQYGISYAALLQRVKGGKRTLEQALSMGSARSHGQVSQ